MKRVFNVAAEKESCFLLPSVCTFGNSILFPKIKMFCFVLFFFQFLGWEEPLEWEMAILSSIIAWKTVDRGPWWATVHEVAESDMTE